MLRNDLTSGLLVWLPGNDTKNSVLILDYKRNNRRHIVPGEFEVFWLTPNGDEKRKKKVCGLKDAFVEFLDAMVED